MAVAVAVAVLMVRILVFKNGGNGFLQRWKPKAQHGDIPSHSQRTKEVIVTAATAKTNKTRQTMVSLLQGMNREHSQS